MIIIIGKLFFTSQRYLCYYVIPLIYTFVIINIIDQFIYWIIYIQKIAIPSEEKYSIWSESLVDKFIKKKLPSFGVHRLIRLVFEEACSQGKSVQHEISTVFPCGAKVHRDVTSGDVQDREISRGRRMGRISSRAKNRGNGLKRLFEQRDDRARCLGASVLNDARPINPANVGD